LAAAVKAVEMAVKMTVGAQAMAVMATAVMTTVVSW
jgi:hypothetical protein